MEATPEFISNSSGWIALAVITGVIWGISKLLRSGTLRMPALKSGTRSGSHGHGDSHGHDDHGHHEESGPIAKAIGWILKAVGIIIVLLICLGLVLKFGPPILRTMDEIIGGPAPGASFETRRAIAERTGTLPGIPRQPADVDAPVSFVRSAIVAPANGDGWSDWMEHPRGYGLWVCAATEGLACSDIEPSIPALPYVYQCRTYAGDIVPWSEEACRDSLATRAQARGSEPIRLVHWLEPL